MAVGRARDAVVDRIRNLAHSLLLVRLQVEPDEKRRSFRRYTLQIEQTISRDKLEAMKGCARPCPSSGSRPTDTWFGEFT